MKNSIILSTALSLSLLILASPTLATKGGESNNTQCSGVGNPNSPCIPSGGGNGGGNNSGGGDVGNPLNTITGSYNNSLTNSITGSQTFSSSNNQLGNSSSTSSLGNISNFAGGGAGGAGGNALANASSGGNTLNNSSNSGNNTLGNNTQGQGQGQSSDNTNTASGNNTTVNAPTTLNQSSVTKIPRQAPALPAQVNVQAPGTSGFSGGISTPFGGAVLGANRTVKEMKSLFVSQSEQVNQIANSQYIENVKAACEMVTETECKELKAQMLRKLGVVKRK